MTGPFSRRLVLDSSVLYSRVLHELFGRLASEARLFDIAWSDELLAETKRVLIERKPVSQTVAERWVAYLREAFPGGRVDLSTGVPPGLDLATLTSDPDDEHVAALAVAAAPATLVTLDQGFYAEPLAGVGVALATPDAVLVPLVDEEPDLVAGIVERQARAWSGPDIDALVDAFGRAGAPQFAARLRP